MFWVLFSPICTTTAMRELTMAARTMGSVPFGGRYRLIDFALSNMVNAGISKVGIITKRNYQSSDGSPGIRQGVGSVPEEPRVCIILPPFGASDGDCTNGASPLFAANRAFPAQFAKEEYVVLSDCHVVGNIDFTRVLLEMLAGEAATPSLISTGRFRRRADESWSCRGRPRTAGSRMSCSMPHQPEESALYGLGLYVGCVRNSCMRLVDDWP